MANLAAYRKQDLQRLAEELVVDIETTDRVRDIIRKIETDPDYDREIALSQIKVIQEERVEEEKRVEKQQEFQARREAEAEERAFELEKLRLIQAGEPSSTTSSRAENRPNYRSLKNIMPIFDPSASDIALYLNLFQRQAQKANVDEEHYVTELLALLPIEIGEILIRLPASETESFDQVRKILLDRFRLSAEAFRHKFCTHRKKGTQLWKDVVFELEGYLNGWLESLEISDLDSLKKLLIAEQIKERASDEIKAHFIDTWTEMTDPGKLATKIDEFEAVRRSNKGTGNKPIERKEVKRTNSFKRETETRTKGSYSGGNWRDQKNSERNERSKVFDQRKKTNCFECNSPHHLRFQCPKLKKVEHVNKLESSLTLHDSFKPYLSVGKVNGQEITFLRDSGSSIDVAPRKIIKTSQLNGETIWVKTPLTNEFKNLPLATVELELEGVGRIVTKTAVVESQIEMDHYILGNQTQEIIDNFKTKPHQINEIVTRSRAKEQESFESVETETGEQNRGEEKDNDNTPLILPPVNQDESIELLQIGRTEFLEKQRGDVSLKGLWEKANEERKGEFRIENQLLFRIAKDKKIGERKQLIIPLEFRNKILKMCHEGVSSAHLGMTKVKDKILRHYFWPNVIKETEIFVKSCGPCQFVGKPRDQKKAPLKLVPIISEVFSRINVDVTGPLPISQKGNKYLLTAICMASKYPEAIPIADMKSESIVEALLIIFSRLGFPKSIQTDQGTCFTSALTSTFLEKFGIKIYHSSVHHPQSNPIERWHRSIKRLLKVLCVEQGEDWEKHLPAALLALRTVTHESTGFSPAELVHGRNLRTPETLLYEHWVSADEGETLVTEYVFDLLNRMKRCQELAVDKMMECQEKRKKWYDQKAIHREFKPGDQVLILATSKPNKLAVNWVGPGEIEKKISETNYLVRRLDRRERSLVYHINMLKPYYQRAESINLIMTEPNEKNEENDLEILYPNESPNSFDVEEIIKENELSGKFNPSQLEKFSRILSQHKEVFSNNPGRTDKIEHDIELICDKPIKSKPYRTSQRQTEILKTEVKRMLDLGIIEIGESDYTSPMILVEAPGREPRPCIDYRKLNSITRNMYFPLPNIEERVEQVAAAKYITVLDLTKGYWQIPLTPRAQRYAGFVTSFGSFKPRVMAFGLVCAPYTFSKFMAQLLQGCEEFCVPYLDDMAIFSETWDDHLKHINCILGKIKEAGLKIKLSKCKWAQHSVKYLGHMVGDGYRTPTEAKIQAIVDFPAPKTKTEIRKFMGMSGYYARYIKNYALISEPLTRALKGKNKREKIEWTAECESAFSELKKRLMEKPVLYSPNFKKEFIIQTDASDKGVGVIMAQREENKGDHPILYLSRKFSEAESRYGTTEKECLAIIFAIKKLRHYLDGQKFVIETDHNPLVWLKTNASSNPRLMRWALALQPFNYSIVHRPGKSILHVDCLSRSFN